MLILIIRDTQLWQKNEGDTWMIKVEETLFEVIERPWLFE